jgi:formate-dependent nitrite reductase membrane component NrfD
MSMLLTTVLAEAAPHFAGYAYPNESGPHPLGGNAIMPIIFILSAMVSGIALCVFNYMVLCRLRGFKPNTRCLDVMGMFLFYALVIDATIEALDWIHRTYSAHEGIDVMETMASERLFLTLNIGQVLMGTLIPLLALGVFQVAKNHIPEAVRKTVYFTCAVFILLGVFAMRWNVVMGGQFFSKSLRGVMSYAVFRHPALELLWRATGVCGQLAD